MPTIWFQSLLGVTVVSLVSLLGVFTLAIKEARLRPWLHYLVGFSAGAMLGEVFLHVLPELAERSLGLTEGAFILGGILFFFVLERIILWHHSHTEHEESVHSVVYLVLIGDAVHNFIDGLLIGASFLVSAPIGIATTIAVIFHEIPHELGNFAVLVHGGWSVKKALFYNFVSALTAVIGTVLVLVFAKSLQEAPTILLSFTIASFVYIAMSDLVPELHKERRLPNSVLQFVWIIVGIGCMVVLRMFE